MIGNVGITAPLLALSIAWPAAAQTVEPANVKVLLTYDDSLINDGQRAALAKILAADVPQADWPTVKVQPNDGLARIVDRYYDVYARSSDPNDPTGLPLTTDALIEIIKEANGEIATNLQPGKTLKIPPVPARALGVGASEAAIRAFDPKTASYALIPEVGRLSLHESMGAEPVRRQDPYRDARTTVVEVSATRLDEARSIVESVTDPQLASLELLQQPNCPSAEPRLTASPYLDAARARVVPALTRLEAAAKQKRLALIDFDFQSGHGARVRSATSWLLDRLGASQLMPAVDLVEMNKRVARADLQALLQAYRVYGRKFMLEESLIAFAALWTIDPEGGQVGTTIRSIPTVLVAAALWRHLNAGSWLSLSWRIGHGSKPEPLNLVDVLNSKGSFVAVAAGNERTPVRADLFPQGASSVFDQFVNITHGAADGTLLGSSTAAAGGGKVDLVTIGCGIEYEQLQRDDSGSSFATPIVAAAAWLKSLLDGTASTQMRRQLLRASLLVPPRNSPHVVSGGVFDPSRLLAGVGAHYLDPSRTRVVPLQDVIINAGACGTMRPQPDSPGSQDVIVYLRAGKSFLLYRHSVPEFPGVRVEPECELTTLSVSGRGPEGELAISSPSEFAATIGHLTF